MNTTWEETLMEALLVTDFEHGVDEAIALGLVADDFVQSDCRVLWRAMVELAGRGEPIASVGLFDEMLKAGVKEQDAANVLARTMDGAPVGGRIPLLVRKVQEHARERKFERTVELANTRLTDGEDKQWVRSELLGDIASLDAERSERQVYALAEVVDPAMRALADRLNGDAAQQGLQTGLPSLDYLTTGINQDELWVVGGLQGRGKTAFGLQLTEYLGGKGFPVYLVSLEMSRSAIFRRLLRMKFGGGAMANPGKLWQGMNDYAADLKTLPLYINDSSSPDVNEIVSSARLEIQRHGARLVIVDYLQLIKAEGKDRREAVGAAANALRILAKDTHVPVVLLSQLRRPMNLNDRPSMIDLKESGDIEAHAHVVLLLYMPTDEGQFTGDDEIVVGKQREGPTGIVRVVFRGEYSRFEERF